MLHITFPIARKTVPATHGGPRPNEQPESGVPSINLPEQVSSVSGVWLTSSRIRFNHVRRGRPIITIAGDTHVAADGIKEGIEEQPRQPFCESPSSLSSELFLPPYSMC